MEGTPRDEYCSKDVEVTDVLVAYGLIPQFVADENLVQFQHEYAHVEEIGRRAVEAWKALPGSMRLRIHLGEGRYAWTRDWMREHDEWRYWDERDPQGSLEE